MRTEPDGWDCDDKAWAIIAELGAVPIEGRLERLDNGVAYVRVLLDDYYTIDCQIDLNAELFPYTIYVRRYDIYGAVAYEHAPYQAAQYKMAAKCVELAHRCHEVRVRDEVEQLMHHLESL